MDLFSLVSIAYLMMLITVILNICPANEIYCFLFALFLFIADLIGQAIPLRSSTTGVLRKR